MNIPYYSDGQVRLHLGNCREVLPSIPDASVDAICTDPPYEIGFMGRGWDATGIAYDVGAWKECLRILKPGGHLLAFGAARTYHRMACAIEDAGFEIRDSIHWIYDNGFPKGQDISKSIDRRRDDRTDVLRVTAFLREARVAAGITAAAIDAEFGFNGMASHWTAVASKAAVVPNIEQWARLTVLLGFNSPEMDDLVARLNARKGAVGEAWSEREVIGTRHSGLDHNNTNLFLSGTIGRDANGNIPITAPASDDAIRWQGWNTSLKPAHEPIVVARKSTGFNTTVANVLQHGTGALNIDGCRIPADEKTRFPTGHSKAGNTYAQDGYSKTWARTSDANPSSRWPANVVFSHNPDCTDRCVNSCPVDELDAQTGTLTSGAMAAGTTRTNRSGYTGPMPATTGNATRGDSGGGSRFFPAFRYEGKAPASERPQVAAKKAMRLRENLTDEQRAYVLAELTKAGVDVS